MLNGFINQARRYIEREKALAAQIEAEREQTQEDVPEIAEGELEWHIIHEADDDNGQPAQWSAKLPNGEFLWIDKEVEGYALYDTHDTVSPSKLKFLSPAQKRQIKISGFKYSL